eukprot:CAMPEP_0172877232 /NCGR_PEP_ID=MMETSP1075-20121228/106460_1 /TAXON_ID=2916 /ORGANISM="Ceratium fusus, Strain PA161109" /LENGTH=65 /DNA_ID=CAMNT_0013728743 /DNA_START=26 /DNA_END=221 /DNA_ORIENTATION=-
MDDKRLLVGSAMLLDLQYFEQNKNTIEETEPAPAGSVAYIQKMPLARSAESHSWVFEKDTISKML